MQLRPRTCSHKEIKELNNEIEEQTFLIEKELLNNSDFDRIEKGLKKGTITAYSCLSCKQVIFKEDNFLLTNDLFYQQIFDKDFKVTESCINSTEQLVRFYRTGGNIRPDLENYNRPSDSFENPEVCLKFSEEHKINITDDDLQDKIEVIKSVQSISDEEFRNIKVGQGIGIVRKKFSGETDNMHFLTKISETEWSNINEKESEDPDYLKNAHTKIVKEGKNKTVTCLPNTVEEVISKFRDDPNEFVMGIVDLSQPFVIPSFEEPLLNKKRKRNE
eukprot:TRINITY_DN7112_c0_g1_i1.p1 TRINITY_DN7112_c0_g1~~TRINITY_DN7112_c0_g1_i1.p1  ORF type:complete len:275 (+),score=12.13 TRINITY_DN7112_c0_g1_i1:13-837(+)